MDDAVTKERTVGKAGERVSECAAFEFAFELAAVGHVVCAPEHGTDFGYVAQVDDGDFHRPP